MKILICPLDWGLGHATRCIPIIRALQACGHEVQIGAAGLSLKLLQKEFPHLAIKEFSGYNIRYANSPHLLLPYLAWQFPTLLWRIYQERKTLRAWVKQEKIECVISDNRYGLYHNKIPSIYITHQLYVKAPQIGLGLQKIVEQMVFAAQWFFLRRYHEIWVPDYTGSKNLSGALSHGKKVLPQVYYIGPLSRFTTDRNAEIKTENLSEDSSKVIAFLAVISGVEPQRSRLEKILREQMSRLSGTRVLVQGLPGIKTQFSPQENTLTIYPHLEGALLEKALRSAEVVITRSGYSTLMELAALQKKQVILIPTPQQTEQEYLARILEEQGIAKAEVQEALDLENALASLPHYKGFGELQKSMGESEGLLKFIQEHKLLNTIKSAKE